MSYWIRRCWPEMVAHKAFAAYSLTFSNLPFLTAACSLGQHMEGAANPRLTTFARRYLMAQLLEKQTSAGPVLPRRAQGLDSVLDPSASAHEPIPAFRQSPAAETARGPGPSAGTPTRCSAVRKPTRCFISGQPASSWRSRLAADRWQALCSGIECVTFEK